MPGRLSRLLSRPAAQQPTEIQAGTSSRRTDSPPPGYYDPPPAYNSENIIEHPDVTVAFRNLAVNDRAGATPQIEDCIAHLKVLECFYQLQRSIGATDGLFGISNTVIPDNGFSKDQRNQLLAKLAEKRWAIYVSRAVARFEAWSASMFPIPRMITVAELEQDGKAGHLCEPTAAQSTFALRKNSLPPVDVLMVWHAYMLNPRAYLEDCLRLGRMALWHAEFAWQIVVDCIDSGTFAYNASDAAKSAFERSTKLAWENLSDPIAKHVVCPQCDESQKIPMTTGPETGSDVSVDNFEQVSAAVDGMLSCGTGYCDKALKATCSSCNADITHDSLSAGKFCHDLRALLGRNVPMGGTILGTKGIPWKFADVFDEQCEGICSFPNALLRAGLGKKILEGPEETSSNQTMEGIRDSIADALTDPSYLRRVPGVVNMRVPRIQRIGIRRMMSRYWENSSPFALDLMGAVIRQGGFIEKMHQIDWLHSPALLNTTKRLLVKYQRFISIIAKSFALAVPTLDIDLAWHTHQLSPYEYMRYTVMQTKQFVDHDDKIAETTLNDAYEGTRVTYQRLYGESYCECTCWYCEAIRESNTSPASRLFKTRSKQAKTDPDVIKRNSSKSVHISVHNSVRPTYEPYAREEAEKADALERQYQKACQRARRKGKPIPDRNDYYYSDAWGYPVYIPAYSPYTPGSAYTGSYYARSPGCMALARGERGNCCPGTCSPGVAAGGCANALGVCAGGVAGGCTSSSFGVA